MKIKILKMKTQKKKEQLFYTFCFKRIKISQVSKFLHFWQYVKVTMSVLQKQKTRKTI